MARPKDTPNKPEIDKETFESLLEIQATRAEIMKFYGYKSKSSLIEWVKRNYEGMTFEQVQQQHSIKGIVSLKRRAFELAEKNPSLMIFLLKSVCGMSETPCSSSEEDNEPQRQLIAAIDRASKALSRADTDSLIAGMPGRAEKSL